MRKKREHIQRAVVLILAVAGLITCTGPFLTSSGLVSAQAAAPGWSYTGNLISATDAGTATLLPNGKVLIVGDGAELYDPATGAWSATGSLVSARDAGPATLLPNGKVLIVGDGAELYDPATGAWSVTGRLNTTRVGHTATLLQNGKVLVAGGLNYADFSEFSTELYDPTTGTWSVTGTLNAARGGHTATLLPNGDVLVTGACNDGIYCPNTSSAELFNPATGTWSIISNLNTPRFFHTATLLLNGQVLIAGGVQINFFSGAEVFLNSAEIYDPASGTWNTTANLNGPRLFHAATLLQNGKVLVVGGGDGWVGPNNDPLGSAELYDSGVVFNPNPIDDPQFFVTQHYGDFLNREPDPAGLAFWTNEITSCGADVQCVEAKRVNVSAAFFLSIEFQQTGYFVYRMYKAAYGDMPGAPLPLTRQEFLPDTQRVGQGVVVGATDWEQALENNRNAFASDFVARSRFTTAFPQGMTSEQFVDALNANAGGVLSQSERDQLVSELSSGAKTQAQVLRSVAEDSDLVRNEVNKAFVLMQYFGYLRRNPNDLPDTNFAGYDFWLNKLNHFNGNFADAEMVKSFISSTEYRQRFGPP